MLDKPASALRLRERLLESERLMEATGCYDGITELFFDDESAMAAAFATDAGKAAGGDAAAHCSNRFRMVCEEKLQF